MAPQVSVATEGGSGTPVPDISIEVDDLDEVERRFEYGPTNEPWGVRRFYVRDPLGRLINILRHEPTSLSGAQRRFAPQAKPRERLMGDTKCASGVSMLLKSGSHSPSVNPSAVIAPNATLVGDVRIGARCVIGYGACLIAEGQPITLGEQVIVRDNAVIRSTAK